MDKLIKADCEEKMDKQQSEFIAYEYKQIQIHPDKLSFMIDSYENFGWILDENFKQPSATIKGPAARVTIRFKRNRKIMNKMELTRLQRNFEFCLKEIDHLEQSKTSKATMFSLIVGIVGTAFMAGSVFAITAEDPSIVLCVIFAIPAFLGWIFPYFIYKSILNKRIEIVEPLIEEKQEEIFAICEKGNRLLL